MQDPIGRRESGARASLDQGIAGSEAPRMPWSLVSRRHG